jgi:signal transduction histidine kinase
MLLAMILFCNKIIVSAFDVYIICKIFRILFEEQTYTYMKYIGWIVTLISSTLMERYTNINRLNICSIFLLAFLLSFGYQSSFIRKVVEASGITLFFTVSELVVIFLTNLSVLHSAPVSYDGDHVTLFLSRIIVWMLLSVFVFIRQYSLLDKQIVILFFLKLLVFLILVLEMVFLCEQTIRNVLADNLALIGAELTLFLIIYLQECILRLCKIKKETFLLQREQELYKRETTYILKQQEEEQRLRHDWNNKLQVLDQLLLEDCPHEAKQYLTHIYKKADAIKPLCDSGNLIIDAILNSKLSSAKQQGIQVTTDVRIPDTLHTDEDDFVIILGNLIDNAIEANQNLPPEEVKYINLSIKYFSGMIFLSIQNPCKEDSIHKQGKHFISSKNDKKHHGIGLKSVEQTVASHHGTMDIEIKDQKFSVSMEIYD